MIDIIIIVVVIVSSIVAVCDGVNACYDMRCKRVRAWVQLRRGIVFLGGVLLLFFYRYYGL